MTHYKVIKEFGGFSVGEVIRLESWECMQSNFFVSTTSTKVTHPSEIPGDAYDYVRRITDK